MGLEPEYKIAVVVSGKKVAAAAERRVAYHDPVLYNVALFIAFPAGQVGSVEQQLEAVGLLLCS